MKSNQDDEDEHLPHRYADFLKPGGITYSVIYMGRIEIRISTQTLDIDSRRRLASKCVDRVYEAIRKQRPQQNGDRSMEDSKSVKYSKEIAEIADIDRHGSPAMVSISSRYLSLIFADFDTDVNRVDFVDDDNDDDGDDERTNEDKNSNINRRCKWKYDLRAISISISTLDDSTIGFIAHAQQTRHCVVLRASCTAAAGRISRAIAQCFDFEIARCRIGTDSTTTTTETTNATTIATTKTTITTTTTVTTNRPIRMAEWARLADWRPERGLSAQRWFHGEISRIAAESLVNRCDGDFLVRNATEIAGQYVLTVRAADGFIRHLLLVDYADGVVRNKRNEVFETIPQMIEYYRGTGAAIDGDDDDDDSKSIVLRNAINRPDTS